MNLRKDILISGKKVGDAPRLKGLDPGTSCIRVGGQTACRHAESQGCDWLEQI